MTRYMRKLPVNLICNADIIIIFPFVVIEFKDLLSMALSSHPEKKLKIHVLP